MAVSVSEARAIAVSVSLEFFKIVLVDCASAFRCSFTDGSLVVVHCLDISARTVKACLVDLIRVLETCARVETRRLLVAILWRDNCLVV